MEKKEKTKDKIKKLLQTREFFTQSEIENKLNIETSTLSHAINKMPNVKTIKNREGRSFVTYVTLNPSLTLEKIKQMQFNNEVNNLPIPEPKIPKIQVENKTQVETKIQVEKPSNIQVEKSKPMASIPESELNELKGQHYQLLCENEEFQTEIDNLKQQLEKSKKSLKLEDILTPRINIRRLMGIYDLLFNKTPNGTNVIDLAQELIDELEKFKQLQKELQKVQ